MDSSRVGFLLCGDLISVSRIEGLAASLNLQMTSCRTPTDLLAAAAKETPSCVLIDLHQTGLDIAEIVPAFKAIGKPFIVGFGSHVAADVLKQARLAGCDLVQPRSQFFAELSENLPNWFSASR